MPMPVGGAFALYHAHRPLPIDPEAGYDPELEEFRKQQKQIQDDLTCTIGFTNGLIPSTKGKISGIMVLDAKEDIEHTGIFILMKGLPLTEKKKKSYQQQHGTKPLTEVKFTVLESTFTAGERDVMKIDGRVRESYPLELEIPEELPCPLLTSNGRLIYRIHVYISTINKRKVVVGETSLRWLGHKKLEKDEINKELKIEQQLQSKRGMMGLGWRKSALLEWRVGKGGYLPGQKMQVELFGECRDKGGMDVECKVELVQKVWYEVPSDVRIGKTWTKMKMNVLASGGTAEDEVVEVHEGVEEVHHDEELNKKMLWRGKLHVPKGITPTVRFDFMNSVSYTIRASVGVTGESKEDWVTGEMPILIGNCKEVIEGEDVDFDKEDGDDDADEEELSDTVSRTPSPRSSESPGHDENGIHSRRRRSDSIDIPRDTRRSRSVSYIPATTRRGSVTSMESLASSTFSMFGLPPSYSQLSSRRVSLDTLPPPYCELEEQRQVTPLIVIHQQSEEDTNPAAMSNLASDEMNERSDEARSIHTVNN